MLPIVSYGCSPRLARSGGAAGRCIAFSQVNGLLPKKAQVVVADREDGRLEMVDDAQRPLRPVAGTRHEISENESAKKTGGGALRLRTLSPIQPAGAVVSSAIQLR